MKKPSIHKLEAAGILLFVAGVVLFMGIITAEAFYPAGYSTRLNEISDLGATRPPDSIITQPSSTIFNLTMIGGGIAILAGMTLVRMAYVQKFAPLVFLLFGVGVLGVGLFPGNIVPWHPIFAMTTFIAGGVSAILSYQIVSSPLRYVFLLFGVISLVFLFMSQLFIPVLGMGGTERWVAYPIVFWLIGLGGYLVGRYRQGEEG
jgi:hypothetical membrane protein